MMRILPLALVAAATFGGAHAAAAATLIDTGVNARPSVTRPVDGNTALFGQFTLDSAAQITAIEVYGRVVSSGTAIFQVLSSVNDAPGSRLFSVARALLSGPTGHYGVSGLSFGLDAGTYFLGLSRGLSTFSSYVTGNAPAPLGREGSVKPRGYVRTDAVDLSWRVSGELAAVSEPAAWAMIIAGVGAIGFAPRRRRGGKPARA